jgi:hypothetical protein
MQAVAAEWQGRFNFTQKKRLCVMQATKIFLIIKGCGYRSNDDQFSGPISGPIFWANFLGQ